MYPYSEILRALGRIEGEPIQIRKLSERVSALEQAQSWLKGGWAILFHRWKIVGAVFALLVQRRWYVRKYSAGLLSGWLMR